MASLAALLADAATAYPDRVALLYGEQRLTYADLDAAADRVADLLVSHGVRPGDTVAISCPNVPAFPTVYFGILKAGAIVVPLNILLKPAEVAYHLTDSAAVAYFAFEDTAGDAHAATARAAFEQVPGCRHLFPMREDENPWADRAPRRVRIARDDDDTAVILYTSGTTGQPKGAQLRHRNMRDNALLGAALFDADAARPDTYLAVLPLFHSFGQTFMQNGAFAYGGTVVLMPRFDARGALDLMLRHEVSVFAGVPTMYWALLEALTADLDRDRLARRLRVAISGGSALPVEIHRRVAQRLGVTILEGYGLSETSPCAAFARWGDAVRVGSIGVPVPGVRLRLVDDDWQDVPDRPDAVGEIAIHGHNVMLGYHRRPEETEQALRDGWFRTGDLARRDADGYYYIVDRAKDLIIRGGYNVYPREVEEILMAHPDVSLAAVIGVADERLGEEVKAVVVRRPGSSVTAGALVAWSREQMAAYKYPRSVEFVDALPMTATGKILKRQLT